MQLRPPFARLRRLRGVVKLVVLGLLCRALIPAGFMPAAIDAGGPVAICHGGLAGEFFRRLEASRDKEATPFAAAAGNDAHAAHDGHVDFPVPGLPDPHTPDAQAPAADHEGWEHCPFGTAFGAVLLADDAAPELPTFAQDFEAIEPALPVPYRLVSSYRARAPPSPASHA